MNQSKKLLVICGSTSSGKTSLALNIAKEINAILISADSRQIFNKMDIGTGKKPIDCTYKSFKKTQYWLIDGIPVYGYDLVNPNEYYSSFDFAYYARNLINTFTMKNRNVILVGGTGYYIDTVTGRTLPSGAGPDLKLRTELNELSLEELNKKLLDISPEALLKIDTKNKVRLVRELEKCLSQKKPESPLPILLADKVLTIGLTAPNDFIFKLADTWVEAVWKLGLPDETKMLIQAGYKDTPPLNGLIYKTVQKYLNNEMTESQALERIKFDIHGYIRRQKTWFKKNPEINWYDISDLSREQIKADILHKYLV